MSLQRPDTLLARLKELGVATTQQIEQAKQEQARTHERFGAVLVRLGMIRDAESGRRLTPQLGWMPAKLEASQVSIVTHPRLPAALCRAHRIVPIQGQANDSQTITITGVTGAIAVR